MTFELTGATCWTPGAVQLYKWLAERAPYAPDSPWNSLGRFGDGSFKTLYVAKSAEGAVAEYLRRHPEFVDMQEDLTIEVHELDLHVPTSCLDVRTVDGQAAVGISKDRLTSSDDDEDVRYAECRALAVDAMAANLTGIGYPSAAAIWDAAWNLVLFGEQSAASWSCSAHRAVTRPLVGASDVSLLPAGH